MTSRVIAFILAVVLFAGAILAGDTGFRRILDFRALERIPLSTASGAVEGEVQLRGRATEERRTLVAPKSGTKTFYYHYLIERREKDSDGNESWKTIKEVTDAVDFRLDDGTDTVLIEASANRPLIDWSVDRKFRRREGDLRYTEWRVDPNDTVTAFGWFEPAPAPTVSFGREGHYLPIISSQTGEAERSGLGLLALVLLWGGVTALVVAIFLLIVSARIHRTLTFLTFVSAVAMLYMANYGLRSLDSDVRNGYQRVQGHLERAERQLQAAMQAADLSFEGWNDPFDLGGPRFAAIPADLRARMDEWRLSAWLVRDRYLRQIDRFPENVYARFTGMANPQPVALPPSLAETAMARAGEFSRTRVDMPWWAVPVVLVAALALAWFAFRVIRIKRLQENLATSKTEGVVYGLAEVEGTLVGQDEDLLLKGPVSGEPCVWYRYIIKERRGSGKNRRWVEVLDEVRKQPFWCEDDEGRIRVFPTRAEVFSKHKDRRREGKRRYKEIALRPGDDLYILGKAKLDRTTGDRLVLGHDTDSPFIIANISEEDVMVRKAWRGMALLALNISLLFLAVIWMNGASGDFSSVDFLVASLTAPAFLLLVVFALMYNDLVFLKQRCERNWANIQVSLKKRADLLPQLERIARGYLAHEADLQEDLAELRTDREAVRDSRDVDSYLKHEHETINRLQARIEAYPNLEGSAVMADLTRRLIRLENEIALIRAGFNDAVQQYRTRIQSFPDNLLSKLFGFRDMEPLHFEARVHKVPRAVVEEGASQG